MLALIASTLQNGNPEINNGIDQQSFFKSRATLVIMPVNVMKSWIEECHKFFECPNQIHIKSITNPHEYETMNMNDILHSDLVLVSYTFFRHKKYTTMVESFIRDCLQDYETNSYFMNQSQAIRTATRTAKMTGIVRAIPFESIWWKRIIFDDVNSIFTNVRSGQYIRNIPMLYSEKYWSMTNHLDLSPSGPISEYCNIFKCQPKYWTPGLLKQIFENCFFRYEPEITGQLITKVHTVHLSIPEQKLWEYHQQQHDLTLSQQIQFCSYFNLNNDSINNNRYSDHIQLQRLDEIIHTLTDRKIRSLENQKVTLTTQENTLTALERRLRQERHSHNPERNELIEAKIDRIASSIERTKISIHDLEKSLHYFENVTEHLKNQSNNNIQSTQELCPICMEDIPTVVTLCGHLFCRPCLLHNFANAMHVCPICKTVLTPKDAFQIKSSDFDKYGSKFIHVLNTVKEILAKNEKIVIYSQFIPLLRALRTILFEQEIQSSLFAGNMYSKNAALLKFNQNQTDILLIHLEALSSGLNLYQANHVIFLHALCDSKKTHLQQQGIEQVYRLQQTKDVFVHWFITQDTIEEQIFRETS